MIILVAVVVGTASVLRLHSQSTPTLVADRAAGPSVAPGAKAATVEQASTPTRKPTKPPVQRPVITTTVVIGSAQQALINQDRARYGLKPLTWSSCLSSIAYSNAVRMAGQGFVSHTDGPARDLGCGLGYHAGENVAYWSGGGLTQAQLDVKLNAMFMNSPDHRANLLSPYYHYVGTAWMTAPNGAHYIAVEFS